MNLHFLSQLLSVLVGVLLFLDALRYNKITKNIIIGGKKWIYLTCRKIK